MNAQGPNPPHKNSSRYKTPNTLPGSPKFRSKLCFNTCFPLETGALADSRTYHITHEVVPVADVSGRPNLEIPGQKPLFLTKIVKKGKKGPRIWDFGSKMAISGQNGGPKPLFLKKTVEIPGFLTKIVEIRVRLSDAAPCWRT